MEDILWWKMTFDGRRPSLEDNLRWKTTFDGRQPSMADDFWLKTTFDGRRPMMEDDLHWRDFEIPLCHIPPLQSFLFSWNYFDQRWKCFRCREVNLSSGLAEQEEQEGQEEERGVHHPLEDLVETCPQEAVEPVSRITCQQWPITRHQQQKDRNIKEINLEYCLKEDSTLVRRAFLN